MKSAFSFYLTSLLLTVSACSSNQAPKCEDILEVNRQRKSCQALKEIMHSKNYPQQANEARKRFEQECVNFRFYRDEFENTICTAEEKK